MLARLLLLFAFAMFLTSGVLRVAKPAPRLFEAACQGLAVTPAETLMVGDNPLTDGGAVEAGLTAYILPPELDSEARGLEAVLRLVDVDVDSARRPN